MMQERELEKVMRDFVAQRFNILLCSTIIETGIDVPSANTTTGIASGASITAVTSASPRMCSRDRPIAAKPAATTDSTTATAETLSENTIACPQRGSANSAL